MRVAPLAGIWILAPLLLPGSAAAQLGVRASVTFAHADHRVEAGFGPERSSGFVLGGAVRVEARRWLTVAAAASAGHLAGAARDVIDRDIAQLDLGIGLVPLAWLALEAGLTVRTYSTVVARQRWTLGRLTAEARVPLPPEVGIRPTP